MAGWGVTEVGQARVQARFALHGLDLVGRMLRTVLPKRLPQAVQYARATYLTGGTTPTRLAERTGRLAKSFDAELTGSLAGVIGRIGYLHGPSWVGIHEYGGTIRPTQSRYLTVPLTETAQGHRAREFQNTFVQRSRAGSLIIFQKTAGGGIQPLYVLKTHVQMPARPALKPTIDKFVPVITDDLRQAMHRALQGDR